MFERKSGGKVTILGAGKMGRAIAMLFSRNGFSTALYDPFEDVIVALRKEMGDLTVNLTTSLAEAVVDADFVIESAPEDIQVKRKLYMDLYPYLKNGTSVASNTSTYSLKDLSAGQSFADRMLIVHFFKPADVVPLVEIVRQDDVPNELLDYVLALLRRCGKIPVVLQKDIPGFIANRLQAAVLREACYLVEQGVAEACDIDTVMKEGIGMRWALSGPFEVADYGGLDIWERVLDNLLPLLDGNVSAPEIIKQKVVHNHVGVKTDEGFYRYGMQLAQTRVSAQIELLKRLVELKK